MSFFKGIRIKWVPPLDNKYVGQKSWSPKATVKKSQEQGGQLFPKDSPEDSHTALRGSALKDSVSIQGKSSGDSFSLQACNLEWGLGN